VSRFLLRIKKHRERERERKRKDEREKERGSRRPSGKQPRSNGEFAYADGIRKLAFAKIAKITISLMTRWMISATRYAKDNNDDDDDDGTARAKNTNGEPRDRDVPTVMMMKKKKQAGSCSAAAGKTYLCCF